MKPTVGVIGLGLMGKPMAGNLLKAGFPVVIWNRTAESRRRIGAAGRDVGRDAVRRRHPGGYLADHGQRSPRARRGFVGQGGRGQGALEGLRKGSVLIDSSTVSPKLEPAWRLLAPNGEPISSTRRLPAETGAQKGRTGIHDRRRRESDRAGSAGAGCDGQEVFPRWTERRRTNHQAGHESDSGPGGGRAGGSVRRWRRPVEWREKNFSKFCSRAWAAPRYWTSRGR